MGTASELETAGVAMDDLSKIAYLVACIHEKDRFSKEIVWSVHFDTPTLTAFNRRMDITDVVHEYHSTSRVTNSTDDH